MGSQESTEKQRSWRKIEALRERKLLRDNLADIWDDDPDFDEAALLGDDSDEKLYAESDEIDAEDDLEIDSDDDSDDFVDDEIFDDED